MGSWGTQCRVPLTKFDLHQQTNKLRELAVSTSAKVVIAYAGGIILITTPLTQIKCPTLTCVLSNITLMTHSMNKNTTYFLF